MKISQLFFSGSKVTIPAQKQFWFSFLERALLVQSYRWQFFVGKQSFNFCIKDANLQPLSQLAYSPANYQCMECTANSGYSVRRKEGMA